MWTLPQSIIYHLWSRAHRPKDEVYAVEKVRRLKRESIEKVKALFSVVDGTTYPSVYGLGRQYNVTEYKNSFPGVDWSACLVSPCVGSMTNEDNTMFDTVLDDLREWSEHIGRDDIGVDARTAAKNVGVDEVDGTPSSRMLAALALASAHMG